MCSQLSFIVSVPVILCIILLKGIATEPKLRLSNQVKTNPMISPIKVVLYEIVGLLMIILVFDKSKIGD